jgi:hypothetical protein
VMERQIKINNDTIQKHWNEKKIRPSANKFTQIFRSNQQDHKNFLFQLKTMQIFTVKG